MFDVQAQDTPLSPRDGMLVELDRAELDHVAGGIAWAAIPIGYKIAGAIIGTGAVGFGAGTAAGYVANR